MKIQFGKLGGKWLDILSSEQKLLSDTHVRGMNSNIAKANGDNEPLNAKDRTWNPLRVFQIFFFPALGGLLFGYGLISRNKITTSNHLNHFNDKILEPLRMLSLSCKTITIRAPIGIMKFPRVHSSKVLSHQLELAARFLVS